MNDTLSTFYQYAHFFKVNYSQAWLGIEPRYLMMTSSTGNIFRVTGPLCGEFPHKGQWRFDRCFLWSGLNKWLSKQWWSWWFETQSRPLWRHWIAQAWLGIEPRYLRNPVSSAMNAVAAFLPNKSYHDNTPTIKLIVCTYVLQALLNLPCCLLCKYYHGRFKRIYWAVRLLNHLCVKLFKIRKVICILQRSLTVHVGCWKPISS